ncbi:FlgD immunoglobulin-like domain containing protein [candidate division KSB1 bacterium]
MVLLLVAFFNTGQAGAQQLFKNNQYEKPQRICATPLLTGEFLEQAYRNTLARSPELFDTPLQTQETLMKGAEFTVGDSLEFWAVDVKDISYYRLWAELRAIGNEVLIWVEKAELDNPVITGTLIQNYITEFEDSTPANSVDPTKGIIEIEHEYFGLEPDIDGDGKTDILLLDIRDNYNGSTNLQFVAGFFSPADQNVSNQNSNKRDMLYLDTHPAVEEGLALATAAHEYQHLIHYNYDKSESNFINEGASQLAQTITGQVWDNPQEFFDNPDRSLTDWASISDPTVLADYAKVQMFFLYLYEQFGKELIRDIVQSTLRGVPSIESVLVVYGGGLIFNDVARNWFIANYLNDVAFDPKYGYALSEARNVQASLLLTIVDYPAVRNFEGLNDYAADYIKFKNGTGLSGTFTSSLASFIEITDNSGIVTIADIPEGVEFTDPAFGIEHKDAVFIAMNETGTETFYSYNIESEQPYFVQEVGYDNGTPAVITGTQRGIWFGTNTPEYQWAVKFSPLNEESVLLGMKAYVLTDTTVMGKPEFNLHVYDDSGPGGYPGQDVITPFSIRLNHSTQFYWMEVDLFDYFEELSAYRGDFYIALEHPPGDTNAVFIAMDNYTPEENHSWGFRGPTSDNPGWAWLENEQLGEANLADFDLMFRAEMSFLEIGSPYLTAGFLQHPVFTENFDVYVIGDKKLDFGSLTGTLTQGGEVTDLNISPTGSTGRVFVDNNVTLDQSSMVSLRFSGTYEFGNTKTDTLIEFNVQGINAFTSGKISNPEGTHTLYIPAHSVGRKTVFTSFDGFQFSTEESLKKDSFEKSVPFGSPTTFGPDIFTEADFELEFTFNKGMLMGKDPRYLRICRFENGGWTPLESIVYAELGLVRAAAGRLGTFQVLWSENFDIVQPADFNLEQNYPNPFNGVTVIRFNVREELHVSLDIFDITGRKVRTLVSRQIHAGAHTVSWDGTNDAGMPVSSGIYIYRYRAGTFSSSRKMILLK